MTPQFVDLNADGYKDMVMGTFEGHVFLVEGSKEGYKKPQAIVDKNGDKIRIALYWDDNASDYQSVNRSIEGEFYDKDHHLTSAAVVDWDNDGDLDLVLGAYEGFLYWCENEGTKSNARFADKNHKVMDLYLADGLATPVITDWNKDGLFDIVCGGAKGGVYLYENSGTAGEPKFVSAKTLIQKTIGKNLNGNESANDYFSSISVPGNDGIPSCPGTSFHIEIVDYDSDGHLDILVGAQSYIQEKPKVLTAEENKKLAELKMETEELQAKMSKLFEGKSDAEFNKVFESEEAQKLQSSMIPLWEQIQEIEPSPKAHELVWLYRNKGKRSKVSTETTPKPVSEKKTTSPKSGVNDNQLSLSTSVEMDEDKSKLSLNFQIQIPDGYHIYGSSDKNAPTKITITDMGGLKGEKSVDVPNGTINLSKGAPQYWLQGSVDIKHVMSVPANFSSGTLKATLEYMICDDKMCLPPDSIELSVDINK